MVQGGGKLRRDVTPASSRSETAQSGVPYRPAVGNSFMTASAAHTKGSEGGFDLVYALVLRARDEAKCSFGRLNNNGAGLSGRIIYELI